MLYKNILACALGLALLAGSSRAAAAEAINVPNYSFETPTVASALGVDIRIDSWQETPKPIWWDDSQGYTWDQLCGVFTNTPPGDPAYIDNCDGKQAMYLFAMPMVGVSQDYNSIDWAHSEPTRAFNAKYEVGKAYRLTLGVIGGGGNMLEGVPLMVSLYYRDAATNPVTVAMTTIVHSKAIFPTNTHFVDFHLESSAVTPTNACAGQNIGIQILSIVGQDLVGGYWDIDNVRLTEIGLEAAPVEGGIKLTWPTATGWKYQLKSSGDLKAWYNLGTAQDGTGGLLSQTVPIGAATNEFITVVATAGQ